MTRQYKIITLPILISYIVFLFLDGLTTYLGTPDLTEEGNPAVRMVGWTGIIIFNIIYIGVAVFLYIKGNIYLKNYWTQREKNILIKKKRKLLHYVIIVLIYSIYIHLVQEMFAVPNNILNISVEESNIFSGFTIQYKNFYKQFFILHNNYVYSMFHTIILSLMAIIGVCIAIYRIRKLKKFQTTPLHLVS